MRKAGIAAALAAVAMAQAADAHAAAVTITGDDGNPLALTPGVPATLRQMKTDVGVTRTGTEQRYTVTATGPAGPALSSSTCWTIPTTNRMDYQGNGTYNIVVTTYTGTTCTGAGTSRTYPVNITAGLALTPPGGVLLTRRPNDFTAIEHLIGITHNPGALSEEVYYALGGVIGPDGAISGPSARAFVDPTTGAVKLRLDQPGSYVMVARAQAFSNAFTPWSAPISFRAIAPFDFVGNPTFPDSRGPSYKVRVQLREKSARGKVRISLARKWRGGKFRSIGKARIKRNGVFSKRFTVRQFGKYRIKYRFKGSATTAPGTVTQRITIRRRFF